MKKSEEIKQLEQRLTGLLGKKTCTEYKRACTGKYRGYYDYSLIFDDGSKCFISVGKEYYLKCLQEKVEMYQYFHDNREYLERRTKEIFERDNRQAAELGLSPVEFISIDMMTEKDSDYIFWIGVRYKQNGLVFWHTDTEFCYACRGVGFNDEKSVEVYFSEKINRPDDKLGMLKDFDKNKYYCIMMGYLRPAHSGKILEYAGESA